MQSIYNYIHETIHVSTVYRIAAVLYLTICDTLLLLLLLLLFW